MSNKKLALVQATPDAPEQYYIFPDGRRLPRNFVYGLIAQIIARTPLLVRGHEYTLRQICGDDYWLRLQGHETTAGVCVLQLCKTPDVVPLIDTGKKNSENHHLYLIE